jgi:hypothetical protein
MTCLGRSFYQLVSHGTASLSKFANLGMFALDLPADQGLTVSVASLLVPLAVALILTVFVLLTPKVLTVKVPLACFVQCCHRRCLPVRGDIPG